MAPMLKTARLLLRPPVAQDAPAVETHASNWNIARMLGRMPHPYPQGGALEFIMQQQANTLNGTAYTFAITCQEVLIGCMGLEKRGPEEHGFEFGYWLGEPYWGRGYATEAGRTVISFAFETHAVPLIHAGHFVENRASGRVLTKLGFRYSGEAMRDCRARGCMMASREMRLERQDWIAR